MKHYESFAYYYGQEDERTNSLKYVKNDLFYCYSV